MFVESIHSDREEWETWSERLRLTEDPPDGLVLAVAWDAGDGRVGQLNVWDSPDKVSDHYVTRVHALVQELGEPKDKPARHGTPIAVYMRPAH
jgi:hypothetical protein